MVHNVVFGGKRKEKKKRFIFTQSSCKIQFVFGAAKIPCLTEGQNRGIWLKNNKSGLQTKISPVSVVWDSGCGAKQAQNMWLPA